MSCLSFLNRRICAMCCVALLLLFAAVQGANLMDRIQHGGDRTIAHPHMALSFFDVDHDAGHFHESSFPAIADKDVATSTDMPDGLQERNDMDGAQGHAHHHHAADHGSSLPAHALDATALLHSASDLFAIPYNRAIAPAAIAALERPPKSVV